MGTLDDVRRIASTLPGAYEHASHGGAPSFRTKPRGFAFHREDLDALAVCVASEEDKHALIAAEPSVFTTPHYDGYSIVLVRLDEAPADELEELLIEAWRLRAPKKDVARWDEEHPLAN